MASVMFSVFSHFWKSLLRKEPLCYRHCVYVPTPSESVSQKPSFWGRYPDQYPYGSSSELLYWLRSQPHEERRWARFIFGFATSAPGESSVTSSPEEHLPRFSSSFCFLFRIGLVAETLIGIFCLISRSSDSTLLHHCNINIIFTTIIR